MCEEWVILPIHHSAELVRERKPLPVKKLVLAVGFSSQPQNERMPRTDVVGVSVFFGKITFLKDKKGFYVCVCVCVFDSYKHWCSYNTNISCEIFYFCDGNIFLSKNSSVWKQACPFVNNTPTKQIQKWNNISISYTKFSTILFGLWCFDSVSLKFKS